MPFVSSSMPTIDPTDLLMLAAIRAKQKKEADLARRSRRILRPYWYDPEAFVRDCFEWPEGQQPTFYQYDALSCIVPKKRVSIRGPHGLGKTAFSSWVVWWFALTSEDMEVDWKCITTASAWRQLNRYLWPEIKKWGRLIRWAKLGIEPPGPHELLKMSISLKYGEAFAVASDDPSYIEGAHADRLLYMFDESKAVPDRTFDAVEGAFSGAGPDTKAEAYALAVSTPGEPSGRFHDIHKRKPGLEDWHPIHVTLKDAIKAGRISKDWARKRLRQWGRYSTVFINRVLGDFAFNNATGVILEGHVKAANARWVAMESLIESGDIQLGPVTHTGVDVAREGNDQTVFAKRHGWFVEPLIRYDKADLMETTGNCVLIQRANPGSISIVDVIGQGAGVVDRLRELQYPVEGFNASESAGDATDATGELFFQNKRSLAWWNLRTLLDPNNGYPVALPPDQDLMNELIAPRWKVTSGGRIYVEGKEDIVKRLKLDEEEDGHVSTDNATAVVLSFYDGSSTPAFLQFVRKRSEEEKKSIPLGDFDFEKDLVLT